MTFRAVCTAAGCLALTLAACQPPPPRNADTGRQVVAMVAEQAPVTDLPVVDDRIVVIGDVPPLVVVDGRAAAIASCLHDRLAEHANLASMGLAPSPPVRLDSGAWKMQPRRAILVQRSGDAADREGQASSEDIGRMTYTTTVAPAGRGRAAVYFEPDAPDLSGTILSSLLEAMRKATRRQARVCAL